MLLRNELSGVASATALFAGLAHFSIELAGNFLPILYPLWRDTLSLNFAQIGAIALVANLATTAPQPLFGWLAGRGSPARLAILGIGTSGVFYALSGIAPSYGLVLLAVALGGVGSAVFHPSGAAVAGRAGASPSGERRQGARMSVFSVGGNAGAALSPLIVGIAVTWLALPGTLVAGAWVLLAAPLLWLLFDGRKSLSAAPASPPQRQPAARGSVAALAVVVVFAGARSWFQVSLISYLPLWIEQQGGSSALAGSVLFVLLASVSVGSLIGGVLSDRIGTWPVLIAAIMLLLPLHYLLLSITSFSGALSEYLVAAAIGCCIGATYPVAIVAAHQAWPRNLALAGGIMMGLGFLPGGLGATVVGVVADRAGLAAALRTLYLPMLVGGCVGLIYLRGKRMKLATANRSSAGAG